MRVYVARSRREFDWASDHWLDPGPGFSGMSVIRMAPWWWRMLIACGLPLPLLRGMRPTPPQEPQT